MSDKRPIVNTGSALFSIAIIFSWALLGLYGGLSGLVKIQIETLKEIAQKAPEHQIIEEINGEDVTYFSPESRDAIVAQENAMNSIFYWVFQIPAPLPHVIAALAFGVLGSIVRLLRAILSKEPLPEIRILLLRPIFGSLIAFMMLGVVAIVPSILTIDETTLRPSSLLFTCFLGGAFAEYVWSWLQGITTKFLPKPTVT